MKNKKSDKHNIVKISAVPNKQICSKIKIWTEIQRLIWILNRWNLQAERHQDCKLRPTIKYRNNIILTPNTNANDDLVYFN